MLNRGYAYATVISSKYQAQACSPTWQAFTPNQLHKPGNKN